MRRLYLVVYFFLSLVTSLYSQQQDSLEWAPLGGSWWYTFRGVFSGTEDCLVMEVTKDTIVNGKYAKIIEGTILQHERDPVPALNYYEDGRIIMHQKGDSVFYLRRNKFELLYDFSLEVGDTMAIVTPGWEEVNNVKDTVIYSYVESIDTIEINGQFLRAQKLKNFRPHNSNSIYDFGEYVIEKIGSDRFFLPINDLYCDGRCPQPLRCYQDDSLFYKTVDLACDTTFLISSTGLKPGNEDVNLYPNPTSSGTELHIEGVEVTEWFLWNNRGKLIFRKESSLGMRTIDIPSPVQPGMYFVELRSGQDRYIRKVVFQ